MTPLQERAYLRVLAMPGVRHARAGPGAARGGDLGGCPLLAIVRSATAARAGSASGDGIRSALGAVARWLWRERVGDDSGPLSPSREAAEQADEERAVRAALSDAGIIIQTPARGGLATPPHDEDEDEDEDEANPASLAGFAALSLLQHVCNHAGVLRPSATATAAAAASSSTGARPGLAAGEAAHAALRFVAATGGELPVLAPSALDDAQAEAAACSGKAVVLLRRLLALRESSSPDAPNRAIVFASSVRFLSACRAVLPASWADGHDTFTVTGSTPQHDRPAVLAAFNASPRFAVLFASKGATSIGLTLTGANHVFLLDPHWNPSADAQAQDRAYRIGQTRDVTVCRMVAAGTVEEAVLFRQMGKQQLSAALSHDPESVLAAPRLAGPDELRGYAGLLAFWPGGLVAGLERRFRGRARGVGLEGGSLLRPDGAAETAGLETMLTAAERGGADLASEASALDLSDEEVASALRASSRGLPTPWRRGNDTGAGCVDWQGSTQTSHSAGAQRGLEGLLRGAGLAGGIVTAHARFHTSRPTERFALWLVERAGELVAARRERDERERDGAWPDTTGLADRPPAPPSLFDAPGYYARPERDARRRRLLATRLSAERLAWQSGGVERVPGSRIGLAAAVRSEAAAVETASSGEEAGWSEADGRDEEAGRGFDKPPWRVFRSSAEDMWRNGRHAVWRFAGSARRTALHPAAFPLHACVSPPHARIDEAMQLPPTHIRPPLHPTEGRGLVWGARIAELRALQSEAVRAASSVANGGEGAPPEGMASPAARPEAVDLAAAASSRPLPGGATKPVADPPSPLVPRHFVARQLQAASRGRAEAATSLAPGASPDESQAERSSESDASSSRARSAGVGLADEGGASSSDEGVIELPRSGPRGTHRRGGAPADRATKRPRPVDSCDGVPPKRAVSVSASPSVPPATMEPSDDEIDALLT